MVEIITPEEREQGPDANQVRRHAKKMLTVAEYNKRYRRIGYYRPNIKQREFHNLLAVERMLRAGNQTGKSTAGAAEMAIAACALRFDWHKGHRFDKPPAIERPYEFLGWAASTTSQTTRDGVQTSCSATFARKAGSAPG